MKLLADEDVDGAIVARLRQDGHEVAYVVEMKRGISDEEVLHDANQKKALLITADKDFGELIFRQGKLNTGILLLRLAGITPVKKGEVVSNALSAHGNKMLSAFSVVTAKLLRIRPKQ